MGSQTRRNILIYIVAIAIPLAVGLGAAWLTRDSMQIYSEVNTPPLSPPSWLFPVVWTILYTLMGVSSAMVYINRERDPESAVTGLAFYAVSLLVNFVWPLLFFRARLFLPAFLWLLLLLYLIIRTILAYRKVSPTAAYLQIPYAVWVTFAGYLNFAIFLLNR